MRNNKDRAQVDLVIVGAGFAGLYMLIKARELDFTTRVFERGDDVGGTWYWNRYPGARCDVQSMEYSFSFDEDLQREWDWTERYATQPEILRYIQHVAERYDLRSGIEFNTSVTGATFDETRHLWDVVTDSGETVSARFVVMATGCLSASRTPDFEGIEEFKGETFHTGHWPHTAVDFTGKRVGVVGTGSSGVQAIPVVAQEAERLFVFQRTPSFTVPARNQPLTFEKIEYWRENYPELRRQAREDTRTGWLAEPPIGTVAEFSPEMREREYVRRWEIGGGSFLYAFSDIGIDAAANATAADFVRARIRETVEDPALADVLTPRGYPIGSKRICVDTNYYATFNRKNVTLVDVLAAPITRITATGIETSDASYPLDAIIFATGYDAMTGALTRLDLTGRDGARLAQKWDAGPTNYLGIMTTGFPNFFMITGPGSPSVLSNVVMSIEQHVEWVSDVLVHMRDQQIVAIEPSPEAEHDWVELCRELAGRTLQMQANSWYLGANVPGKPRVFMPFIGGSNVYRTICADVAAKGYLGFILTTAAGPQAARPIDLSLEALPAKKLASVSAT